MRVYLIFLLNLLFACAYTLHAPSASAQSRAYQAQQQFVPVPHHSRLAINNDRTISRLKYLPVREPEFEPIKYLKLEPPASLNDRIERLIHGIAVDMPPPYDHFGYEIRRYMASVAKPEVLASQNNIKGQIKNIKNAEIILKYWKDAHQKEIAEIEAEIEKRDTSPSTRSIFKYHRGIAEAFFVEAQSWMFNNRKTLEMMLELGPNAFRLSDSTFSFQDRKQLSKFLSHFKAQQQALTQIQEYTPFRMMVY